MVHAENGCAIDHLVAKALAAGQTDPIYHALTRPEAVRGRGDGARDPPCRDTPAHRSTSSTSRASAAADEIIAARARGVAAYGETCIQYLFASIDDLRRPDFEGARYVCSPPLRDAANQPHIWDALIYDHLQSISTDHCPFNDEQKRLGHGDFSKIPNGLAAIQHRLPLMWEHGVREGRMSMNRLVEVTSTAIAKIFGLYPNKGTIARRRRRRHRHLRPEHAIHVLDGDLVHERRLRPLGGQDGVRLRRGRRCREARWCSIAARSSPGPVTAASSSDPASIRSTRATWQHVGRAAAT